MSALKTYAKRIPHQVRSERILTGYDPIQNAVPVQANPHMLLLFEVWFTFIEPTKEKKYNCPVCLQNVLNNFREMKGDLIELEREYQLLKRI